VIASPESLLSTPTARASREEKRRKREKRREEKRREEKRR